MDRRHELQQTLWEVIAEMERDRLQGDDDQARRLVGVLDESLSGGPDGTANENPRHMAIAGSCPAGNLRGNTIRTSIRPVTTVKEY